MIETKTSSVFAQCGQHASSILYHVRHSSFMSICFYFHSWMYPSPNSWCTKMHSLSPSASWCQHTQHKWIFSYVHMCVCLVAMHWVFVASASVTLVTLIHYINLLETTESEVTTIVSMLFFCMLNIWVCVCMSVNDLYVCVGRGCVCVIRLIGSLQFNVSLLLQKFHNMIVFFLLSCTYDFIYIKILYQNDII